MRNNFIPTLSSILSISASLPFLLLCLQCRKLTSDSEMPPLYVPPVEIPLNTNEGYTINQFTGDSVKPLFNYYLNDTVETGKKVIVTGKSTCRNCLGKTEEIRFRPPKEIPLPSYIRAATMPSRIVHIDETKLSTYTPGDSLVTLVNYSGDTIPVGIAKPLYTNPKPWKQPLPRAAQAPTMRDNAIINVRHLEVDHGMASSDIYKILEDKRGIIWFCTADEVSQYDGVSFRDFAGDETAWIRYARDIIEDSRGDIWITSSSGIVRTNGSTYSLMRREDRHLYANDIPTLFEDARGNVWLGSQDGILIQFRPATVDTPETLTHHIVRTQAPMGVVSDIAEDRFGNLWIATSSDGLFRYNGTSFMHFTQADGLPNNKVNSICLDHQGELWFGTEAGLCRYIQERDRTQGNLIIYTTSEGLSNDLVRCVYADREDNIWLTTWGGGVNQLRFDKERNLSSVYHFSKAQGLSNDLTRTIFEDRSGNIWIGSLTGGVNILKPGSFEHFTDIEGLTNKNVRSILEDQNKNIWIGTEGPGIFKLSYNSAEQKNTLVQYSEMSGKPIGTIYNMFEDNAGHLWFGSKDDVYFIMKHDQDPSSFTRITMRSAYDQTFTGILQGKDGDMWFGTYGGGLIRWNMLGDKLDDELIQYTESEGFSCNYIFSMTIDDDGNLWIATDYGLCYLKPLDDGFSAEMTVYSEREGLPSNFLYTVSIDDLSNIWLGTSFDGICKFSLGRNEASGLFTSFTEKQGLSSNDIKTIQLLNDTNQQQTIWASTKNGLTFMREDSANSMGYKIFTFGRSDGLKISEFNNWGGHLDSEKRIWWSGGKGVERANAHSFSTSQSIPSIALRSVYINSEHRHYQDFPDSLRKGIGYSDIAPHENYMIEPVLAFNKNNLTFHYTAIDWSAPQKIRYSYFMEGLSDAWSAPSSETKTDYRNLPPGTFTFKVRAIGESQIWSEPFEYTFTIRPPWYFSTLVLIFYVLLGGSLIYALHRFQLTRKLEKAEKKRLLELDTIKNRLYTNITHEFRTPLTLIHGPVSLAIANKSALDEDDLKSIHRQSERLQQLITQMLDLQKIEAGKMKPNFVYGEVVEKLRYIISLFESWSREKNIALTFSAEPEKIFMDHDEEKLTQIMSNLISNAIKHTPRDGKVTVDVSASHGKKLVIRVEDTGTGIGQEDLPFIFDRFYQAPRAAAGGTGIGLSLTKTLVELLDGSIQVNSTLNAGTSFTLQFPITESAAQSTVSEKQAALLAPHYYDDELKFLPPLASPSDKPIALIVEDHHEVAQFVASCLKKDFSTIIASNGDEGIRSAFEHIPDLVISDVMMPVKDGFEVCATLKKDIQTSHIPVILLTGRGDQAALMEGIEHGADAYVVKPFEPQELILRAKKLLELRATLSEYYRKHATQAVLKPAEKTSEKENAFLQKIRAYIEEHMMDPQFSMQMLCQHMAMSHPQLHRKMTALTGESTGKFVRSVRLTKAIDLLKNSDLTVSEIAYETGFSEPGYFTKVFSKEYNMTPTEYRAS